MNEGFPQEEYFGEETVPVPPTVEDVSSVGNLSPQERVELKNLIDEIRGEE